MVREHYQIHRRKVKRMTDTIRTPDLFTVTQTALALGVSPKRVRQLIQEGKLMPVSYRPVILNQLEVLALRAKRADSPIVRKVKTDQIRRSKSRDELYIEKIDEILQRADTRYERQLETVKESQQVERDNFLRLLAEKDSEIARLREQADIKRSRWHLKKEKK